ncbi:hypothetical protein IKF86_01720 [Candidatus Saccharibacteria bacterium]|nr:hypothetical protein [Candidatus Saccharibacteria bacterium]
MILKSMMIYIEGLKESLTNANACRDTAEQAMKDAKYAIYKNSIEMGEIKKEVAKRSATLDKNQALFEKAWGENPGLREKFERMLDEHDEASRVCDEYRAKADEAFAEGNIPRSKAFRRMSIEKKDICVELQQQIGAVRDLLRSSYGIEKNYNAHRKEIEELKTKKTELHEWETIELALKADADKAEKVYNVLKLNATACWEQFDDAWRRYYEVAMELGDVPEEMRGDAKVIYKPEEEQTMILFGEQDPETGKRHGHVQLNNENDDIIYYRSPRGLHGARNFTGKYQQQTIE